MFLSMSKFYEMFEFFEIGHFFCVESVCSINQRWPFGREGRNKCEKFRVVKNCENFRVARKLWEF